MKETSSNNVKVFIRIRPFKQSENKNQSCIISHNEEGTIMMKDKQSASNLQFTFDKILPPSVSQQDVYNTVALNVIENGLEGINGTIFAYGQTSSGKTHTCIGPNYNDQELKGLLPRMISNILKRAENKPATLQFRVKLSMVEIYNQKVKDLLDISKDNLKIRSNKNKGIYIENVTQKVLLNIQQAQIFLKKGIQNRAVGCTNMNAQSSRSHMVFLIGIYQNNFLEGQAKSSKITLIDLAGSEKISKTGAQGKLLQQAKQINKSLSALGKVINALSDSKNKGSHIPYRDSKLTRLLQESLGGNSLTSLIVNVSPSSYNQSETMSSLRFGYRAKSIENKPKVNKEYTIQQLTKMLEKAQKKMRDQQKIIESYEKKKRVGGYGCFSGNSTITMHVICSESQSDSQLDNQSIGNISRSIVTKSVQKERKSDFTSVLSITDNLNQIEEDKQPKKNIFYSSQHSEQQNKVRISILQNSDKQLLQIQLCQHNQNNNSRKGILQNSNLDQKSQIKKICQENQQEFQQINVETYKINQKKKSSHVKIQDKQNIYQIKQLEHEQIFRNCKKSKSGQDFQQSLERVKILQEIIADKQRKYAQLLVKYSSIRSQNGINRQIIRNLDQQLNERIKLSEISNQGYQNSISKLIESGIKFDYLQRLQTIQLFNNQYLNQIINLRRQMQQAQQKFEQAQTLISQSYQSLGQIKITFRLLHIVCKQLQKKQLFLDANKKLIQVKRKADQISKKNLIFFLRESFIPSMDSKIGDLAINYGRFQNDAEGNKVYQIAFVASPNSQLYG